MKFGLLSLNDQLAPLTPVPRHRFQWSASILMSCSSSATVAVTSLKHLVFLSFHMCHDNRHQGKQRIKSLPMPPLGKHGPSVWFRDTWFPPDSGHSIPTIKNSWTNLSLILSLRIHAEHAVLFPAAVRHGQIAFDPLASKLTQAAAWQGQAALDIVILGHGQNHPRMGGDQLWVSHSHRSGAQEPTEHGSKEENHKKDIVPIKKTYSHVFHCTTFTHSCKKHTNMLDCVFIIFTTIVKVGTLQSSRTTLMYIKNMA
jgi:hypothetical protein